MDTCLSRTKKVSNMKVIIGIDPGKSGAFAFFWEDSSIQVYKMDEQDFVDEVSSLCVEADYKIKAYLEEVHAMPGQGVTSMFSFGNSYGFIRGALQALEIPTELVRPTIWQKELSGLRGLQGAPRKRKLKEHAARLFPAQKPTLVTCDALLIARYGKIIEGL